MAWSFIALSLNAVASIVVLKGISASEKTHEWNFTLHLNAPTRFRGFFLHNPLRYVVDLQNTQAKLHFKYNPLIGTPIKSVRYSPHPDNIFRVVFDLECPVSAKLQSSRKEGGSRDLAVVFIRKKHHIGSFSWPFGKHLKVKTTAQKTDVFQKKKHNDSIVKKSLRNVVIVIDPGHGGKDPGATGAHGTHEKSVVLKISMHLYRMLNKLPGFHAVLTRRGDYYLKLRQRLKIARKDRADMFVAIHADAWKNRDAHGVSVFALSRRGATSEAARWLAARENQSELMGGVDLQDKSSLLKSVLINLSQVATIRSSLLIGESVMKSVSKVATLHHKRVEQAAFVVLKSPDIPSLLVETGFISNPKEERLLKSGRYQQRLAHAIMIGIKSYFEKHPPRYTYLYAKKHHALIQHKRYYQVKKGDSLGEIAQHFGVSLSSLINWNHLRKTEISVGQQLLIKQ